VEALLAKARKSQIVKNWIGLVRARLAAHRGEKPPTKAAQIRALWPEVEAALHGGHGTKKICAWLEEEAGITVGVTSLTSYISRLRRQEHAGRRVEAPPLDFVRAETRREPVLALKPTRPLVASSSHTNRSPLPPEDPLAQAMRAVSTPAWVKQMGTGFMRVGQMSGSQAVCAMNTIASMRSMVLNYERPVLETELPLDGSRFEGLIPPVVRHPVFAIRRRPKRIFTLDQYCRSGILTGKADPLNRLRRRENFADQLTGLSHVDVIRAAIAAKKNILTAGSTGSGKTTFTNAILDGIADISPNDRVISIEDTTELQCSVENYADLRAVGSVTMLDCLRACMRLKPNRIVVGEVRGAEAHTMLKAWNTGHPGGAATVHANDALSGLIRLEAWLRKRPALLSSS
jgi:type IV secretion system protein VirB11